MATAGIPFPSSPRHCLRLIHTTTGQGGYFRIPGYNLLPATQLLLPESVWSQSQSSDLLVDSPAKQRRRKDSGSCYAKLNVRDRRRFTRLYSDHLCRLSYSFFTLLASMLVLFMLLAKPNLMAAELKKPTSCRKILQHLMRIFSVSVRQKQSPWTCNKESC